MLAFTALLSCKDRPERKIFVKSILLSGETRIDWYVHSSVSNFAPDFLQLSTNDKTPFFVSFYLSDIKYKNDTLFVSLWKGDYDKLDKDIIGGITVKIDSSGTNSNDAMSRIGRLKDAGVDIFAPHLKDAPCVGEECD